MTYNVNGGSGTTPSSQTANSGATITLASGSGLTKSGSTFSGWNTNESGTGTSYAANSSYTVTSTPNSA
ncbi:MAG: InlB B-repeat-containing protein [Treponema sp.]|nr:InlB B-repeat-containing protein [Treponema sp.]